MNQATVNWKHFLKLVIYAALSALLAVFFAAPFIKAIKTYFGNVVFWSTAVVFSVSLLAIGQGFTGLCILATFLMIGIFQKLISKNSLVTAGAISVFISSALIVLVPIFWAKNQGVVLKDEITQTITVTLGTLDPKLAEAIKPNLSELYSQLPSVIALGMMLLLATAILLESLAAKITGLPEEKIESIKGILEFRMPDIAIWLLMAAISLSFWNLGNEELMIFGRNMMNVLLGAYFIQGLAVVESILLIYGVSAFFKVVFYFLIVGQLFILLCPVGIIDYWADLRRRAIKLRSSQGRPNNGENL